MINSMTWNLTAVRSAVQSSSQDAATALPDSARLDARNRRGQQHVRLTAPLLVKRTRERALSVASDSCTSGTRRVSARRAASLDGTYESCQSQSALILDATGRVVLTSSLASAMCTVGASRPAGRWTLRSEGSELRSESGGRLRMATGSDGSTGAWWLSIVRSWSSPLGALSSHGRRSITRTASRTTTGERTSRSGSSAIRPANSLRISPRSSLSTTERFWRRRSQPPPDQLTARAGPSARRHSLPRVEGGLVG